LMTLVLSLKITTSTESCGSTIPRKSSQQSRRYPFFERISSDRNPKEYVHNDMFLSAYVLAVPSQRA
jgi:hypothetical protein